VTVYNPLKNSQYTSYNCLFKIYKVKEVDGDIYLVYVDQHTYNQKLIHIQTNQYATGM
jgi:hypothetical protein